MAGMNFVPPTKTEYRVCPFCGHKDFCSIGTYVDGSRYFYCRRPSQMGYLPSSKGEVINASGTDFVFKGITDNGAYRYEEKSQYDSRRREYASSFNENKSIAKKTITIVKNEAPSIEKEVYSKEDIEERDRFYRRFLKMLVLEDYHASKLIKEWGQHFKLWSDAYLVRSMPPMDFVRFSEKLRLNNPTRKSILEKLTPYYPDKGIAGFYIDETKGKLAMYPHSGILYPLFNSKKQIVCLRLGVDYPTVSNESGDYYYSPYSGEWSYRPTDTESKDVVYSKSKGICKVKLDEKGLPIIENRKISNKYKYVYTSSYENGLSYGSQVGLYLPMHEGYDSTIVFGTEGEKKCIVGSNMLSVPFVDITGVNNFNRIFKEEDGYTNSLMDALVQMGCKVFVVAYDADKAVNGNVLMQEQKFLKALLDRGIKAAVASWGTNWGKGLDDALMNGIRPSYYMVEV